MQQVASEIRDEPLLYGFGSSFFLPPSTLPKPLNMLKLGRVFFCGRR